MKNEMVNFLEKAPQNNISRQIFSTEKKTKNYFAFYFTVIVNKIFLKTKTYSKCLPEVVPVYLSCKHDLKAHRISLCKDHNV